MTTQRGTGFFLLLLLSQRAIDFEREGSTTLKGKEKSNPKKGKNMDMEPSSQEATQGHKDSYYRIFIQ